jgi:hypothetical protein
MFISEIQYKPNKANGCNKIQHKKQGGTRVARWYIFSNQKPKFGKILEGLAKEDVGIFCVHLVYFTAICHIIWAFGTFPRSLVNFSHFGML